MLDMILERAVTGVEIRAGIPRVGPERGADGAHGCEAQDDGFGFVVDFHFCTPCFDCCVF